MQRYVLIGAVLMALVCVAMAATPRAQRRQHERVASEYELDETQALEDGAAINAVADEASSAHGEAILNSVQDMEHMDEYDDAEVEDMNDYAFASLEEETAPEADFRFAENMQAESKANELNRASADVEKVASRIEDQQKRLSSIMSGLSGVSAESEKDAIKQKQASFQELSSKLTAVRESVGRKRADFLNGGGLSFDLEQEGKDLASIRDQLDKDHAETAAQAQQQLTLKEDDHSNQQQDEVP